IPMERGVFPQVQLLRGSVETLRHRTQKCLRLKAGQKLLTFDSAKIKAAGYDDTVVVLLTNSDDLEGVECGAK
ncbi:MAG: PTS glucose transporter subunit IIA, partial [Oscillospiraceae bacterium]|nr:PTS glucose transporter subunit IIA [Oscillospiraceae bacterium]